MEVSGPHESGMQKSQDKERKMMEVRSLPFGCSVIWKQQPNCGRDHLMKSKGKKGEKKEEEQKQMTKSRWCIMFGCFSFHYSNVHLNMFTTEIVLLFESSSCFPPIPTPTVSTHIQILCSLIAYNLIPFSADRKIIMKFIGFSTLWKRRKIFVHLKLAVDQNIVLSTSWLLSCRDIISL